MNVNTTVDELTVNGNCSLREAVETFFTNTAVDACPNDAADDTIVLPAGTYTLTLGVLALTRNGTVAIVGAGAGQTIIDADNGSRAFTVGSGANVTISGVTIRNASGTGLSGGAIFVDGSTLAVRNSAIEDSQATFGAGIFANNSTLTVEGSTISGNIAATRGGGIFSFGSITTILNSTIHNNAVTGSGMGDFDGGGIRAFDPGTLTIRNSTIAGNSAANNGGGIANSGTTTPATVSLSNTILAGNTDTNSSAPDCVGTIGTAGYNLVGSTTGCTFTPLASDQTSADPLLGPLQANGGPTQTLAIGAGSPARDAGNPAAPGAAPACATTDQRGIARPQGARCDIGAFEFVGAPTVAALAPNSATAGDPGFTLTVTGTNFVDGLSTVRWGGAARTTTFVSATELQATISAADIATAGTISVTVQTNLTADGGTSGDATFTVNNPAPTSASLAPDSAIAGAGDTLLTITGTGFVAGSTVSWNGAPRATTVLSSTELQVTIPAADLATAGTASVTVTNAAPGGGTSSAATFTINNPAPTIISLAPDSAIAGAGDTLLTITGTGFVAGSTVSWNGAPRATTVLSSTEAQISIPATDLATAGTANVTVANAAPGGGTSNAATFTINNPAPVATSLSPTRVPQNSPAFTLTVTGTGFVDSSVVRWAGGDRATSFVSGTRLEVSIPASDLVAVGEAAVTVFNPTPGGGSSAPLTVTIFGPPTILTQPESQEIAPGTSVTLTVGATGEAPLSYQWYIGAAGDDSNPIGGETASSLSVTPNATSSYWVRVSNAAGAIDSEAAIVRLIGAPEITEQPQSQSIFLGQTATLTVTATGEGLTYQWYQGSSGDTDDPVGGATGASFITPALTETTRYWVQVTNRVGTAANSDAALVTVLGPPAITADPQSQAIFVGQTATLTVTATGEGLAYQWYAGNSGDTSAPVAGATGASFTTPALTTTTRYWARVSNPAGADDSAAATVTVNPAPNPAPTLSAISPTTVTAGGPGFRLVLTGSNFISGSLVRWNGESRTTTFVSATRLEIEVSAADIAVPGSATVTVFNPGPGGGSSVARTITIAQGRLRVFLPMVIDAS